MQKVKIIYSKEYEKINFGSDHPFSPQRFKAVIKFYQENITDLDIIEPEPATEEHLKLVHTQDYINLVKQLSKLGKGYLSIDTPAFKGMYEWATKCTGGSILAAEKAAQGETIFDPCGGYHHARKNEGTGFCIFNDIAIAAKHLHEKGIRVAVVDWDAHAGDGTMSTLYKEPILKISIHEDPHYIYPGDGFKEQVGEGKGHGYTINIPLPPYATDEEFLMAINEIVIPALEKYQPEVILLQAGADGYFTDPLTHLAYTIQGYREAAQQLRKIGAPVAILGGGGYDTKALPIIWATVHLTLTNQFEKIKKHYAELAKEKPVVEDKETIQKRTRRTIQWIKTKHPYFK